MIKESSYHESIQFEALWVLTNITAGTRNACNQVCKFGLTEIKDALESKSSDVRSQAVWALTSEDLLSKASLISVRPLM